MPTFGGMEDPEAVFEQGSQEVEAIDPRTMMPDLYKAAKENNMPEVARYLGESVPTTYVDKDIGWTALHWIAKYGDVKMTMALLENGASGPYHRQCVRENKIDVHSMVNLKAVEEKDEVLDGEGGAIVDGDAEAQQDVYEDAQVASKSGQHQEDFALDYLKNTPLQWAVFQGHLEVIWALLSDGYSPNDFDDLGNNCLHLASGGGHKKIVQVLVDNGAMATAVNVYKNRPVDMAKTKEIRDILMHAMIAGASLTEQEIAGMHATSVIKHRQQVASFNTCVANHDKFESPRTLRSIPSMKEASRELSTQIDIAKDECMDEALIQKAETLVLYFDTLQEYQDDLEKCQENMPITTQNNFIDYCHPLQFSIAKCEATGLAGIHMNAGRELIAACKASYWLCTLEKRLLPITCAAPENHHDMVRLNQAILKAQAMSVPDELVDRVLKLYQRLDAEEKMSIALRSVPEFRLPMEEPPEGYWQESDKGKIDNTTEGYPLPPEDGKYVWIPSANYSSLAECIEKLKGCTKGAEELGANAEVLAKAIITLKKCEKDMKLLDVKNEEDKASGIEDAAKEAKKLKKGKGKKK